MRGRIVISIPVERFVDILSGRVVGPVLPRDAIAGRVAYDASTDCWRVIVKSASFPQVYPGAEIPEQGNVFIERVEIQ